MSRLTKDPTEDIINNSIEIYEREVKLHKVGNNYKCLCYHGENTPSCNISDSYPFLYKCFGCGNSGNVISFISKLHNITYSEAIDYIKGLKIVYSKQPTVNKSKAELIVDWVDMPFSDRHKRYFEEYELDESFLNSRDVYALKVFAINKKIQKIPEHQYKFAYFAKDINQIKILTLGKEVSKDEKWRSMNIPNTYIWNLWRYKDIKCDNLFVCKSVKDDSIFAKLGYCSVSLQSESAPTFLENNVTNISNICDNPIIVMGTDNQGFNTSLNITKKTGWRWFNVKKRYFTKYDANDPAELVKVFSLNKLKEELKLKNL